MTDSVVMSDKNQDTSEQVAHNQKMEQKFDNQLANQPQPDSGVPQRPENVPEKFWNAETGSVNTEALLKSYSEFEKKFSSNDPADGQKDNNSQNADDAGDESINQDAAALNYDRYTQEFTETGDLTPESYAELAKAGIPEAMVKEYLDGQAAIVAMRETAAFSEVGGKDAYEQMIEWAGTNLSGSEIAQFDKAVSGTQAEMLEAVKGLKAKFVQANGSEGLQLQGFNGASTVPGYESMAQMKADMKDPRYKTDEAFRRQVQQKLERSPNLF